MRRAPRERWRQARGDDRAEAREELKLSVTERDELERAKNARMLELLEADAEFQRLKTAYDASRKRCEKLVSIQHHYRFTVGVSNGMFFIIKAQGDSWEEVIKKVEKERAE